MPPSYNEVIADPSYNQPHAYNVHQQPMAPDHQVSVQVIPTYAYNVHHQPIASGQFDEQPKLVTCPACFHQVTTVVDSAVSTSGLVWVIICCLLGSVCCLLGSWISNYLVICFPGFRKYTHTCPKCGAIIAQTEPKHTTPHLFTIAFFSILIIILILLDIWYSLQ